MCVCLWCSVIILFIYNFFHLLHADLATLLLLSMAYPANGSRRLQFRFFCVAFPHSHTHSAPTNTHTYSSKSSSSSLWLPHCCWLCLRRRPRRGVAVGSADSIAWEFFARFVIVFVWLNLLAALFCCWEKWKCWCGQQKQAARGQKDTKGKKSTTIGQ